MDTCEIRSLEHRRPVGHKWVEIEGRRRMCVACLAPEDDGSLDGPESEVRDVIAAIWNA